MIVASVSASQFHVYLPWVANLAISVSNVLIGAFNQKKTQVGAFFVIVKTNGSFAAQLPHTPCAHAQLLCKKLPEKRFPVSRTNNN